MAGNSTEIESRSDILTYSRKIPIRGYLLSLDDIKLIYRELDLLNREQGKKAISTLTIQEKESEEQFSERKKFLLNDAFKVTVSIIGYEGEVFYGENEKIFESNQLPKPIKTIFFTNQTAYAEHANGEPPPNSFSFWFHFDKPPVFDASIHVSAPTQNSSEVTINAEEVGFFRAVESIVKSKLNVSKRWYSFIHERSSYDIGLWFIFMPLTLYWATVFTDYVLPEQGEHATFRIAFFIYCLGLSLLLYRLVFEYLKWAYPVNLLVENKDRAMRHRIVIGTLLISLAITTVESIFGIGLKTLLPFLN